MDKAPTTVIEGQQKSAYTFENMQEWHDSAAPVAEPEAEVTGVEVEQTTEGESHEEEDQGREEGRQEGLLEEEPEVAPAPAKKVRSYSVKVGDETITLTEDIELDHRVDGKPVNVSIGQLLNRYAGEESLDARHQRLKAQEKEFSAIKQNLTAASQKAEQLLKTVTESWQKKDLASFFKAITENTGIDQVEFEENLLNSLSPIVSKWSQLSDDQKKALVNSKKITNYELREQKVREQAEQERKNQTYAQELRAFCDQNGISTEEFLTSFEELRELQEGGHLSVEFFRPQDVVSYVQLKEVRKRVESAIEKVSPDLANDAEIFASILNIAQNQECSDEDLEEIVQEVFGKDRATEKLNKKLNKTPASVSPKISPKKDQQSKRENRGPSAPWTFDDIL